MSVIKNIAFCNRLKLSKNSTFKELRGQGFTLLSPIFDLLHYWLPLSAKFLIEYFIAYEKGTPVGLIGLQACRGNAKKIRITNFILEKNYFEIGEQLINFAVMKYCSIGANSFSMTIEQDNEDIRQLFLKKCGFRVGSKEIIFDLSDGKVEKEKNFSAFGAYKTSHLDGLIELYSTSLSSQHKYSFQKNIHEFKKEFLDGRWAYVLENEEKNEIYGFVTISTSDNKNYVFECFLSSAFGSYFLDVINFVRMQISKRNQKYNLYLKHKSCYYNSDELAQYAFSQNFKAIQRNIILTKDFLNIARENVTIQNAKIIFNDITPAFNK